MNLLIGLALVSAVEWVLLLIVIPVAQRLADFSLPPAVELAWKLFVLVLLKNVVWIGVDMAIGGIVAWIATAIVFWVGLKKLLDIDVFGIVIILIASFLLKRFVIVLLLAYYFSAQ